MTDDDCVATMAQLVELAQAAIELPPLDEFIEHVMQRAPALEVSVHFRLIRAAATFQREIHEQLGVP